MSNAEEEVWIIKLGSKTILDTEREKIDMRVLSDLADDVAALVDKGKRVVIVTSGARELGGYRNGKSKGTGDPQTAASRGMPKLMTRYQDAFEGHGIEAGLLLPDSRHFIENEEKKGAEEVEKVGVIPFLIKAWKDDTLVIVNENDPLTGKDTTLGENDNLTKELARALKKNADEIAEALGRSSVRVAGVIFMSVNKEDQQTREIGRGGANSKAAAIEELARDTITSYVVDGKGRHIVRAFFEDQKVREDAISNSRKVVEKRSRRTVQ